ncbi:MAG: 23S rRNA (pseudouridine(1915)-N(3))-methyltransferase RlmH [Deferribacteres bacterium]|nr:23S rRNA (pseudouridine(1915)-N(3))-methyltransferase RlmH [candidate division KSB1 bacterium]MCB9511273.1 23S rRNA (pseudouridine(1915)-N(3))-methyltransferase RlmH [Deferribacteres bacterium]
MNITICAVGKLKRKYWLAAAEEYQKRLGKYARLSSIEIKDSKNTNGADARIREDESARLLQRISPSSLIIALDKSGTPFSSDGLADFLHQKALRGQSDLTFCIGGPLGFSGAFLQKAERILSFSPMTFPHELARVMLLEQLYRAFTILNGEKYHK